MIGAFGRSRPDLSDFQPPTLEMLPEAAARNVAIARARTRARIMAMVKADGYGTGPARSRRPRSPRGEWLGTTDIAEASEPRARGLTLQIPQSAVQDGLESAAVPPSRDPRQPLEPGKEPKHQPMGGPSDGRI